MGTGFSILIPLTLMNRGSRPRFPGGNGPVGHPAILLGGLELMGGVRCSIAEATGNGIANKLDHVPFLRRKGKNFSVSHNPRKSQSRAEILRQLDDTNFMGLHRLGEKDGNGLPVPDCLLPAGGLVIVQKYRHVRPVLPGRCPGRGRDIRRDERIRNRPELHGQKAAGKPEAKAAAGIVGIQHLLLPVIPGPAIGLNFVG